MSEGVICPTMGLKHEAEWEEKKKKTEKKRKRTGAMDLLWQVIMGYLWCFIFICGLVSAAYTCICLSVDLRFNEIKRLSMVVSIQFCDFFTT